MAADIQIVRETLRDILEEYRCARPHLSLRSIARNSGVNRYFLSKLLEPSNSFGIDLDQMLAFCSYISQGDAPDPIKDKVAQVQDYLMDNFYVAPRRPSQLLSSTKVMVVNHSDIDMFDRTHFFVLLMACCDNGFSKTRIVEILGESARSTIDRFLELGKIIEKEDSTLSLPDDQDLFFTPTAIRFHLPDIIRYYNLQHRGENRNHLSLHINGLSKEAIETIVALQLEFGRKIESIVMDERNQGPNPFFVTSCSDTLTDKVI